MNQVMGPGGMEMVLVMLIGGVLWIGVPVAVVLYARRVLRALEGRSASNAQIADLTERLQRLEDRVEDMVTELEQVREGEQFTRALIGAEGRRKPSGSLEGYRETGIGGSP